MPGRDGQLLPDHEHDGFSTRCCRRTDVPALPAGCCCAVRGARRAALAREGIDVKSAELYATNGDDYYLDAQFEIELTPTLEEALNKGCRCISSSSSS